MREILDAIQKYKYVFAIWTDHADFITDKTASLNEDRLLEIRCFDESGEYLARRDCVGGKFLAREITRENEIAFADGSYDEAQYLDIDTTRSDDTLTYAAGAGSYHLPQNAKDHPLILVRTYYTFDAAGVARKFDWRLVKFTDKETVGEE